MGQKMTVGGFTSPFYFCNVFHKNVTELTLFLDRTPVVPLK